MRIFLAIRLHFLYACDRYNTTHENAHSFENYSAVLAFVMVFPLESHAQNGALLPPSPPQWPLLIDADQDGLTDTDEILLWLNPLDSADGLSDLDGDGLSFAWEWNIDTAPDRVDTDADGWSDSDEILLHGTDPRDATSRPADAPQGQTSSAPLQPSVLMNVVSTTATATVPPSLMNGDFTNASAPRWYDATESTSYQGRGFKWGEGIASGWTAYRGSSIEIWQTNGQSFVELDGNKGSYGIKQPIKEVRAGTLLLSWKQSGRNNPLARNDAYYVQIYYQNTSGAMQVISKTPVYQGFSKSAWTDNAHVFTIKEQDIQAAAGAPIYVAYIPEDLNTYGTLIDEVHLALIEIQTKDDLQGKWLTAEELKVAKWENAFDSTGFRNEHPEGMSGLFADVDRFRIRINTQELPEAYRKVYISTKGSTEDEYNDDSTEILLELDESPYGSSDGFVSKPIILVADSVDNKFKNENAQNDQTHIAALGSEVEFRLKIPGDAANLSLPVRKKKTVHVDLILLWQGGTGPSQFALDNMADDIKTAKEIYAQVGIQVTFTTGAYQVDASVDLSDGLTLDTIQSQVTLHPEGEAILNAFGTPNNQTDVVGLYVDGNIYTKSIPNGEVNGIAFWDQDEVKPYVENPIFYFDDSIYQKYKGTFFVKVTRSNKAVLAHELGHVLGLLHPDEEKELDHQKAKRNLLEGGGISYTGSYKTDHKRFMLFQQERMHSSQFMKNPQN